MPKGNPMPREEYHQRRKASYRKYYYSHLEKCRAYASQYAKDNPEQGRRHAKKSRVKCLKSWEGFLPTKTNCQICGKEIFYNQKNPTNAIHFDHRNEGREFIKSSPTTWLRNNLRTPTKEKIWESCNFGMICRKCNGFIPTIGRKEFITKVLKYMEGK